MGIEYSSTLVDYNFIMLKIEKNCNKNVVFLLDGCSAAQRPRKYMYRYYYYDKKSTEFVPHDQRMCDCLPELPVVKCTNQIHQACGHVVSSLLRLGDQQLDVLQRVKLWDDALVQKRFRRIVDPLSTTCRQGRCAHVHSK